MNPVPHSLRLVVCFRVDSMTSPVLPVVYLRFYSTAHGNIHRAGPSFHLSFTWTVSTSPLSVFLDTADIQSQKLTLYTLVY